MAAPPPHPPRQKLDFDGHHICAPIQRSIEEIPVVHFDAALGDQHYRHVMQKRINRARAIAPATFYESSVTPTENPQNRRVDPRTNKVVGSGDSHHIIEISYSEQKHDPSLAVQLLVNDGNGYMTAKRVRKNDEWGTWQQFTDIDGLEAPEFLNAQVVDLPASHDIKRRLASPQVLQRVTIGGSMEEMFYGLVGPVEHKKEARLALRRAILLFCEALRLRSIFLEMIRRILFRERPSELSDQAWSRIGSWTVLSKFLIKLAMQGRRMDAELTQKLAEYTGQYGLSTFEQLIEELQVLRYSDKTTNQIGEEAAGTQECRHGYPRS